MPLRSVWKIEWKDSKDAIFRDRPAALITREDILARLNAIRRVRGSYAARHALDAVRRIFSFAANHGHSGIKVSPAASLRDKSVGLTGSMMRRQRGFSPKAKSNLYGAQRPMPECSAFSLRRCLPPRSAAMIGPKQNGRSFPASTATIPCSRSPPPGIRSGASMRCHCRLWS
jgi:hypothetical protein